MKRRTPGPSIIPLPPYRGSRRNLFVSARDRRLCFNLRSFPGPGFPLFRSESPCTRVRDDPDVQNRRRSSSPDGTCPIFPVARHPCLCLLVLSAERVSATLVSLYAHFFNIFRKKNRRISRSVFSLDRFNVRIVRI